MPSRLGLSLSVAVVLGLLAAALRPGAAAISCADELVPVGVAKVDITPESPVRMYGYAARKKESEGIAGRLTAKALAIGGDDDLGPAVLLMVDIGAVPNDMRDDLLRRLQSKVPLRTERFVVCNTHNHSGPNVKGMASLSGEQHERLAQYARMLGDRLEQVVLQALASRQPGHLEWTQGSVGFAANRRVLKDGKWVGFGAVPEAAVDHSLPLLRVTNAKGDLLAVVVNYACHCTTLRGDFMQIHGDWAGCAQAYIEADHPGALALICIGCGADADPCPHSTVERCQQHGRALADEVSRLLNGQLKPLATGPAAQMTTLTVPYDKLPSRDELDQLAKTSYSIQNLTEQLDRGEKLPAAERYHFVTWVFGDDLAMVFLSNEVVADYALRMKREFDANRLWVSAYTNDVSNYIVSKRLIEEGGYEVRNSLSHVVSYGRPEKIQPAMEDRIIDAVRKMLPDAYQAPHKSPALTF